MLRFLVRTTPAEGATTTGSSHPVPPAHTPSPGSPSLHMSRSTTRSREPSAPSPPPIQTPDQTLPQVAHHPGPTPSPMHPTRLSPSAPRDQLTQYAIARSPFLRLRPCRTDHPSSESLGTKCPSRDSASLPRPRKTEAADPSR